MSGISLLPPNGGNRSPQLSFDDHHHHGNVNSGDSVHSHHSTASSKGGHSVMSRPPGLSLSSNVQPIGKPGHAKSASTSSTAYTATLTPTSSLDGGASNDLYGIGRQTSPSSEHLPGISHLGSFDTDDGEHDGLLGLQALRDRAHSSPGPVVSSGFYSTSPRDVGSLRSGISHNGRPRTFSKDGGRGQAGSRPPLAGGSAISPHTDGFVYPGSRSRDASPPPNAGVISRPEVHHSPYGGSVGGGSDGFDRSFDSSLRGTLGADSTPDFSKDSYSVSHAGEHHLSSKFSPLPFSQQQQQRGAVSHQQGNVQNHGIYQRHQRSQSQPGPGKAVYASDVYLDDVSTVNRRGNDYSGAGYIMSQRGGSSGLDMDYSQSMQQQHEIRYHPHEAHNQAYHVRSMSMQHPASSNNDVIYDMQRRGSAGYFGGQLQRRDMEFGGHEDGRIYHNVEQERIGNTNYPRQDRLVSPAHSPLHVNYGHHSRQSSDMGSTVSSSPMSLSSGVSIFSFLST